MKLQENVFKRALREGRQQIGFWVSLGNATAAEIAAGAGFDWIVLDAEHSPSEVGDIAAQLRAAQGGTATPVARPPWNDEVMIKRFLDVGAHNLLIPMIQTADEARRAVAATRYAPTGARGFSGCTRSNRYARCEDYFARIDDEICLLVQIETRRGLDNLEEIAAVEGVDGVFIGPGDLSADMGHLGNPRHPEVLAAIADAIVRIRACGKAPGILDVSEEGPRQWLDLGCQFVAVGIDQLMLARQTSALAARYAQP